MIVRLFVVATVLHYGSGGTERFIDAISVAAWAYFPNTLFLIPPYVISRHEIQALSFDGSDPSMLQSQIEAASNGGFGGSSRVILLLVLVGWSVYILVNGTAGPHDVDVSKAAHPAALIGICASIFSL